MIKLALGAFFAGAVGSLAKRVLLALGMGFISLAGVSVALNSLVASARGSYNSLSSYLLAFCGLAGVGDALGIIVGAIVFRISITAITKLAVLPK